VNDFSCNISQCLVEDLGEMRYTFPKNGIGCTKQFADKGYYLHGKGPHFCSKVLFCVPVLYKGIILVRFKNEMEIGQNQSVI
jgi:hypothetical protein